MPNRQLPCLSTSFAAPGLTLIVGSAEPADKVLRPTKQHRSSQVEQVSSMLSDTPLAFAIGRKDRLGRSTARGRVGRHAASPPYSSIGSGSGTSAPRFPIRTCEPPVWLLPGLLRSRSARLCCTWVEEHDLGERPARTKGRWTPPRQASCASSVHYGRCRPSAVGRPLYGRFVCHLVRRPAAWRRMTHDCAVRRS